MTPRGARDRLDDGPLGRRDRRVLAPGDDLQVEQPSRERRDGERDHDPEHEEPRESLDGLGAPVEVGVHQSTRSTCVAPIMDRDGKRADDRGQDRVVDGSGQGHAQRVRDRERRAESTHERERHHRIQQADDECGDDRRQRPDPGKELADDGRAPHAEQEGEWCRSQRPLCEYIDSEPTNEGPDEAGFQSDRDRDDHPEHEHQMRLSISDPEVRGHGQFEEGRHRRSDRGEQQGH